MICLIALVVFGVLAIFSAKYRGYFKEAADCVFRRMTLRKCTTSFDKKMKVKISSKLSSKSKKLGSFTFKHFESLSWIVTIIMIVSLVYSAFFGFMGVYNWYVFGNCNGPDSNAACVFNDLTGANNQSGSCAPNGCDPLNCGPPDFNACSGTCQCVAGTCQPNVGGA